MTVREGALDLEVLVKIDQPPAGEHRADHVDDLDREVREVPEVLVPDLPALAVGAAQQVGRVHHSVLTFCIDYGYVSRTSTFRHSNNITPLSDRSPVITLATPNRRKEGPTPINTGDRASDPQKLPARRRSCRHRSRRRMAECGARRSGAFLRGARRSRLPAGRRAQSCRVCRLVSGPAV